MCVFSCLSKIRASQLEQHSMCWPPWGRRISGAGQGRRPPWKKRTCQRGSGRPQTGSSPVPRTLIGGGPVGATFLCRVPALRWVYRTMVAAPEVMRSAQHPLLPEGAHMTRPESSPEQQIAELQQQVEILKDNLQAQQRTVTLFSEAPARAGRLGGAGEYLSTSGCSREGEFKRWVYPKWTYVPSSELYRPGICSGSRRGLHRNIRHAKANASTITHATPGSSPAAVARPSDAPADMQHSRFPRPSGRP